MANNRSLPSAHIFNAMLARALQMAQASYDNAANFGKDTIPQDGVETGVDLGGGGGKAPKFSKYEGDEANPIIAQHDRKLAAQIKQVSDDWAIEFTQILGISAPLGAGFKEAIAWLRGVVNGADRIGNVGQGSRQAQAENFAVLAPQSLAQRGFFLPPGANAALMASAGQVSLIHTSIMAARMSADRIETRMKMRVDAAEALLKAYDDAVAATLDYLAAEMHLMFDVFGRNNDFLVQVQREYQSLKDIMDLRSYELAALKERLDTTHDSQAGVNRELQALTERANTRASTRVEANIKMLRRYASRAASALNSVGVSIDSSAQESNNLDAEE